MYAIKRTTTTYLLIYIYTKDMLYIFYNIALFHLEHVCMQAAEKNNIL